MELSKEKLDWYKAYAIMGASNTSDTIVRYVKSYTTESGFCDSGFFYQNMQTGKESANFKDVLREGKKYIFIDSEDANKYKKGYLAKYFPEDDALLAAFYDLDIDKWTDPSKISFSWKEAFRFVLTKEGCTDETLSLSTYYERAFDLCGQFIHNDFELPQGYASILDSGEEMRKFCDGIYSVDTSMFEFDDFTIDNSIMEVAHRINKHMNCIMGIEENDMDGIVMKEQEIPKETVDILGRTAWEHLFKSDSSRRNMIKFIQGFSFSYLQECNGEYVLRCFHVSVCRMPRKDEKIMPLSIIELKRVHLTEKSIEKIALLYVPILCYDKENIENGRFKYAVNYIEDAINRNIKMLFNSVRWDLPVNIADNMCAAYAMAYCPFIEKLVNYFPKKDGDEDWRVMSIFHIIRSQGGNSLARISRMLGGIDSKQSELHKILEIPKSALEVFKDKNYSFEVLRVFKEIFSDNKDYMMHMDKDTVNKVFSFILSSPILRVDNMGRCLLLFINIFGTKSIAAYIDFFIKEYFSYTTDIVHYIHYLEKLRVIKEHVNTPLTWKVNREDLLRTDDAINEAYNVINDKEMYKEVTEKFKKLYEKWQKYEYQNDEYIVTYPKGPTELVEEGIRLNHCAKTFIESVANGKTTILFIRKKDAPHKPFFTLEVRDNFVRQCHGVNNCKADEDVFYFLIGFCCLKEIELSNTLDEALGAE